MSVQPVTIVSYWRSTMSVAVPGQIAQPTLERVPFAVSAIEERSHVGTANPADPTSVASVTTTYWAVGAILDGSLVTVVTAPISDAPVANAVTE